MNHPMNSSQQTGLSLVEILVAMVISLFLLAGVIQVFSANKATYGFSEALSRNQENGRFAIDTITRDLRMSGFTGCAVDNFVNNLNVTGVESQYDYFNQPAVDGTENLVNGSDTITIRGPSQGQANIITPYNSPTSDPINTNATDFLNAGDIVLLANCKGADIFQVSDIDSTSGTQSVLHDADADTPGNTNLASCSGGTAHCLSQTYGGDSSILKMETITYSIATGASGEPALFRTVFSNTPEELVDGVQQLEILYGVSTDTTNTTPNQYITSDNVTDWDQVTAVRIMLLLRSPSNVSMDAPQQYEYNGATVTATDRRLRQVFSTTIALRNRI